METPEGAQTPQDFVYKTKIVVLNYLGFGPPAFDMPISPDTGSPGSGSDTGSDVGSIGSLDENLEGDASGDDKSASLAARSEEVTDRGGSSSSSDWLVVPEGIKLRSKSLSPRPRPSSGSKSSSSSKSPSIRSGRNVHPVAKLLTDQGLCRHRSPLKRRSTFEMHEQYQVTLRELLRSVDGAGDSKHIPQKRHSWDTPESWQIQYKKAMDELIESVQTEDDIRHSPEHSPKGPDRTMHEQFQQSMQELRAKISNESSTGESPSADILCPLSREAIVAERIAQIGDRIMETHGRQLEQALRNVMDVNDGKLSYALFKAVLKETIQSHVPGWYHLAVTLNFTRHLALGLLWSGNRGIESVSDFATRYIEENLATTILDQGGWEAITCINLDDIDDDSLSGISSGGLSPYTADMVSTGSSVQTSPPSSCSSEPPRLLKSHSTGNRRGSAGRRGSGELTDSSSSGHQRVSSDWRKDRKGSLDRKGSSSSGGSATQQTGVTLRGIQQRELNLKLENLSKNQKYMRRKAGNSRVNGEGGEESSSKEGGNDANGQTVGGESNASQGTDHTDLGLNAETNEPAMGGEGVVTKSNGGVVRRAGRLSRTHKVDDSGSNHDGETSEQTGGTLESWVERGKVVAASAALAGITLGMYALMKR